MVVGVINEFLYSPVQFFLCLEFMQVNAFVFQHIEVSLHWRIVVWVSRFAHVLGYMDEFTALCESH